MSSNKNVMTTLFGQLDRSSVDGTTLSKSLTATNLVNSLLPSSSPSGSASQLRPGADTGLRTLSFTSKDVATGIQFGSPSSSRVGTTGPSAWSTLLKQTASGSAGSVLGGGGLSVVGTLGGIGGLISGLSNLFGGKSTPPPLVEFQLPQVQAETMYVGGNGSSSYQNLTATSNAKSSSGTYTVPVRANTQNLTYQSSQIAQAVKQAILSSNSLNDVIAEI
jgi:hypothetical protein